MTLVKGFSLIEVLISLVLFSTTTLLLLKQFDSLPQYSHQLQEYGQATVTLDALEEYLINGEEPPIPQPYQWNLQRFANSLMINLSWGSGKTLVRQYTLLDLTFRDSQ